MTLIELPRLCLSFKTKKGRDGKIRTYSCDYGDLFISDSQSSVHTVGMPRVLVLEDLRGRQFLLVPNWKLSRPKILSRPLSTVIGTSPRKKKEWGTKHFIYAVHPSGTFLITKTLAASLYLVGGSCSHRKNCDVCLSILSFLDLAAGIYDGTLHSIQFNVQTPLIAGRTSDALSTICSSRSCHL